MKKIVLVIAVIIAGIWLIHQHRVNQAREHREFAASVTDTMNSLRYTRSDVVRYFDRIHSIRPITQQELESSGIVSADEMKNGHLATPQGLPITISTVMAPNKKNKGVFVSMTVHGVSPALCQKYQGMTSDITMRLTPVTCGNAPVDMEFTTLVF